MLNFIKNRRREFILIMNKINLKKISVLILVSIVFTISSLFWTTYEARQKDDLQRVQFGWPFSFEVQSRFGFKSSFPQTFFPHTFHRSGDYFKSDFLKSQFLGSLIINSMLIASLWSLIDPNVSKNLSKKQS